MSVTALGALVRAAWAEDWNRNWRFSPWKLGVWLLLLQLGLGTLLLWRLRPVGGEGAPGAALLLMATQAGLWRLATGFLGGRSKLYVGRSVALLHLAPVSGHTLLLARVVTELPGKAPPMLLWSVALGTVLPPGARWVWLPLLWLTGMAAATLGELAGLLGLVLLVRTAPRAVGAVWVALMAAMVVLIWYLIYLLAAGIPADALAAFLREARWWLVGGLSVAVGLPGTAAALWLARAPGGLSAAYRAGWLNVADLAGNQGSVRHSRWPGGMAGPAGATLAATWLLSLRNPLTWFRVAGLGLLLMGLVPLRSAVERLAAGHPVLTVAGAGVGLAFFAFGEVIPALFGPDGPRVALWVTAGVRPGQVLAAKLLAATPFALLCSCGAWAAGWAAGLSGAWAGIAGLAGLVGLGMAVVAVGLSALDVAAREPGDEPDEAAMTVLLEQVPRGVGGTAGMLLAGAFGGGLLWALDAGLPWFAAGLSTLPLLAAAFGWLRLRLCLEARLGD